MTAKGKSVLEDELATSLKNVEKPADVKMEIKAAVVDEVSKEASSPSSNPEFYNKAQKYWSEVPATVNGMLGGLGYISAIDIQSSGSFLHHLKTLGRMCALDCGAGIGRVAKNLLMPRFKTVDLVEQDEKFSKVARDYCTSGNENTVHLSDRLGIIYNVGLQQFCPEAGKYDLIWSQWVLGHLTDDDLLALFRRMRVGLTKGGYFIIKENVSNSKETELDDMDSSVTRPLKVYETLLRDAGYRIIKITRQQRFPKGLYPVYMIACRPAMEVT